MDFFTKLRSDFFIEKTTTFWGKKKERHIIDDIEMDMIMITKSYDCYNQVKEKIYLKTEKEERLFNIFTNFIEQESYVKMKIINSTGDYIEIDCPKLHFHYLKRDADRLNGRYPLLPYPFDADGEYCYVDSVYYFLPNLSKEDKVFLLNNYDDGLKYHVEGYEIIKAIDILIPQPFIIFKKHTTTVLKTILDVEKSRPKRNLEIKKIEDNA